MPVRSCPTSIMRSRRPGAPRAASKGKSPSGSRARRHFIPSSRASFSLTREESGTTDLIDYLRHERIDAAFIRTTIPDQEGLVVDLLLQEAMVLALPQAHPLARRASLKKALPLKALADETFIVYRRHN